MVQRLLAEEPKLKPADIGLLLPDEFEYAVAVEDAFRLGGLALSGLPAERWRRDLGREAVFHFLYCRQKPAPAMALAVCLSSPLMPWSREQGAVLAQAVMDGDYESRGAEECECGGAGDARALARGGQRARDARGGAQSRSRGCSVRRRNWRGTWCRRGRRWRRLCAALAGAREIEWSALKRTATPKLLTSGETPDFNLRGRDGLAANRRSRGGRCGGCSCSGSRRIGIRHALRSQCGVLGRGPRRRSSGAPGCRSRRRPRSSRDDVRDSGGSSVRSAKR